MKGGARETRVLAAIHIGHYGVSFQLQANTIEPTTSKHYRTNIQANTIEQKIKFAKENVDYIKV